MHMHVKNNIFKNSSGLIFNTLYLTPLTLACEIHPRRLIVFNLIIHQATVP